MLENLKIKTCPCCEGLAVLTTIIDSDGTQTSWIRCEDCGLTSDIKKDVGEVVKVWNDRRGVRSDAIL